MTIGGMDSCKLRSDVWLTSPFAGLAEALPNPLRRRKSLAARGQVDFSELVVVHQDLEALHVRSVLT